MMYSILKEIGKERKRQDKKWGGLEHDNNHNCTEWIFDIALPHLLRAYATKSDMTENIVPEVCNSLLRKHAIGGETHDKHYRKQLLRVATIAVAAIEAYDRESANEKGGN